MEAFKLIADVGFPIAAAMGGGYFVFLMLRFILDGVMGSIKQLSGMIVSLDNRVKTMTHDVIRIDTVISKVLGVSPDIHRLARVTDREDQRKD